MTKKQIKIRLEELRKEIIAERISTAEIAELQSLADYIDLGDGQLLEWAGVPEFKHDARTCENSVPCFDCEALK